jgi:hypothetical protein
MQIRVAIVFALTFLGGDLRAQEAAQPQEAPRRPIAETVERLMRQPDFRLNVTVDEPVELWVKPLFIRPQDKLQPTPVGTYYHTEYLRMTTPEAFRSSTLYPMGVGVDPGDIANGFRRAWRSWQEERIRKRVEQELADFLAAQDKAQAAAPTPAP